jgi:predicted lysophospholipase L1 biosynthesis ABC-type transport system permease subunit
MSGLTIQVAYDTQQLPIALINTIIVTLAVLFTLLVVAIGLSLSATESRDERDVLVAVGAPPKTLTRGAGAKAITLAATGVTLAVPTGFLPTWVVYRTVGDQPIQFPWVAVGLLVLVVPVAAGVAAWVADDSCCTIIA